MFIEHIYLDTQCNRPRSIRLSVWLLHWLKIIYYIKTMKHSNKILLTTLETYNRVLIMWFDWRVFYKSVTEYILHIKCFLISSQLNLIPILRFVTIILSVAICHLRAAVNSKNQNSDIWTEVCGPTIWNDLPARMKDPSLSFDSFWKLLKTFLFDKWLSTTWAHLWFLY